VVPRLLPREIAIAVNVVLGENESGFLCHATAVVGVGWLTERVTRCGYPCAKVVTLIGTVCGRAEILTSTAIFAASDHAADDVDRCCCSETNPLACGGRSGLSASGCP
jgi:hypothetical protein